MRFDAHGGATAAAGPAGQDGDAPPEGRKRRKKKLPKIVSAAEAGRLMEAAGREENGARNRLMLELMYRAGLRVSEVCNLAPRDVEPDGIVRLYDAKGGDGTAYFDPDRITPMLDRWLAERASWGWKDSPRLFVHWNGKAISTRYVQRLVGRLRAELGIAGRLTPHVLRHTYATEMLEEGFTLVEVQGALRHANLQTTAVYLHLRDESLRKKMAGRGRPRPDDTGEVT